MRHTVLLVEDDTQTRARLAEVVAAHPSLLLVDAVGSVAEGRDALREHQPAGLLTDLGLPDGEGSELIREAVATNDKTLVMTITVFGDESHVVSPSRPEPWATSSRTAPRRRSRARSST
jgi:DNA-binding NarL/FixJ family response regulator